MSAPDPILVAVEVHPTGVVLRLDDGEELTIAADALPADLPDVGGSLGSPLLQRLRTAAARKQAARRLFELLARRLWTRQRLERKLTAEGLPPAAVTAVLDEAAARGIHSDRHVAEAYCRDALRTRTVGRAWLVDRLRRLGVAGDLARQVVAAQLSPAEERDLARRAAASRWRRETAQDARALARVQRFLQSRGFPAGICREAAQDARPGGQAVD